MLELYKALVFSFFLCALHASVAAIVGGQGHVKLLLAAFFFDLHHHLIENIPLQYYVAWAHSLLHAHTLVTA